MVAAIPNGTDVWMAVPASPPLRMTIRACLDDRREECRLPVQGGRPGVVRQTAEAAGSHKCQRHHALRLDCLHVRREGYDASTRRRHDGLSTLTGCGTGCSLDEGWLTQPPDHRQAAHPAPDRHRPPIVRGDFRGPYGRRTVCKWLFSGLSVVSAVALSHPPPLRPAAVKGLVAVSCLASCLYFNFPPLLHRLYRLWHDDGQHAFGELGRDFVAFDDIGEIEAALERAV